MAFLDGILKIIFDIFAIYFLTNMKQSLFMVGNTIMNREQMDCTAISQSLGCMRSMIFQLSRSLIALVKVSLENPMALGGYFHLAIQS